MVRRGSSSRLQVGALRSEVPNAKLVGFYYCESSRYHETKRPWSMRLLGQQQQQSEGSTVLGQTPARILVSKSNTTDANAHVITSRWENTWRLSCGGGLIRKSTRSMLKSAHAHTLPALDVPQPPRSIQTPPARTPSPNRSLVAQTMSPEPPSAPTSSDACPAPLLSSSPTAASPPGASTSTVSPGKKSPLSSAFARAVSSSFWTTRLTGLRNERVQGSAGLSRKWVGHRGAIKWRYHRWMA